MTDENNLIGKPVVVRARSLRLCPNLLRQLKGAAHKKDLAKRSRLNERGHI